MKVRASQCVGHLCHGCDEILVRHLSLTTEDFVCFFFFCQVLGRNASLKFFNAFHFRRTLSRRKCFNYENFPMMVHVLCCILYPLGACVWLLLNQPSVH